jgi:hypothetical protein
LAKGDHSFKQKPRGSVNGGYRRPRVQIGFDTEQIKRITEWSKFDGCSFAAEVRQLVDAGLRHKTR